MRKIIREEFFSIFQPKPGAIKDIRKRSGDFMKLFRHQVFWPPFLLLVGTLIFSLMDAENFLEKANVLNDFVLEKFGWLFSAGTALMLLVCIVAYFHPIGKQKIGGADAEPFLNRWRWFSIVLCTTVATGIIFWGTAEPIYHLTNPPSFKGLEPNSAEAANNALSTMYLHWSFTPYAIYSVPAVMFALAFYNNKRSFSLKSTLYPFVKEGKANWLATVIDSICLFALVAGMAASLGAGILTLSGGLNSVFEFDGGRWLLLITLLVVSAFVISAITGLMRGIRILSDINIRVFFALALFVFFAGPTVEIISGAASALWDYFIHLPEDSVVSMLQPDDPWPKSWTTFYWANWLAWAPITSLFLGRLGYGYTVRQFLTFNWILPSLFGIFWMSVFSGTALHLQLSGTDLADLTASDNPEGVIYALFEALPLSKILAAIFLFTAFLSYVTAADSNTEAMGGISSTGISPESPSPPVLIKIVWGLTIGTVAFLMVKLAGIDGIKMLSNLGGLPALFLIITVTIGLIWVMMKTGSKR
ncbi:BCCT family transporter [Halocola ammonii]